MALSVQFERHPNRLRFEAFPAVPLDFREDNPKDAAFVHVKVADTKTNQVASVFLRTIDLQKMGISLTVWQNISHDSKQLSTLLRNASRIEQMLQRSVPAVSEHLAPEHLTFFTNRRAFANRIICNALHGSNKHVSGIEGVPGIYFHSLVSSVNIFINLKKTQPLGEGTYGKVRKVLWLNAPGDTAPIVAKKVLKRHMLKYSPSFELEIAALREFSGKRGIISQISSGAYDDKYAIFMPLYECTLYQYFYQPPFLLSLNDILNVTSQWLDGLATISEKGVHGDLGPQNLLLRRGKEGIDGVIADFTAYRSYENRQYGVSTFMIAPPEYWATKTVTPKHDVWGMGICLHEIFARQWLPCWQLNTEREMTLWTAKLTPDWILKCPICANTPPFLVNLINEMLDPRANHRPSPREAFERFSAGYSSLL